MSSGFGSCGADNGSSYKTHYVNDEYTVKNVVQGAYCYRQKHGKFPDSAAALRRFIDLGIGADEAAFDRDFRIDLSGESPTQPGVISVVEGISCGSWRDDNEDSSYKYVISGWIVDPDDKKGLLCFALVDYGW